MVLRTNMLLSSSPAAVGNSGAVWAEDSDTARIFSAIRFTEVASEAAMLLEPEQAASLAFIEDNGASDK